jgi:hypothetical protein
MSLDVGYRLRCILRKQHTYATILPVTEVIYELSFQSTIISTKVLYVIPFRKRAYHKVALQCMGISGIQTLPFQNPATVALRVSNTNI